jgi:hypothetical protein
MMTRQARPSAAIMGFDTHMILEAVPAPHSNAQTAIRTSTGHYATMPRPWERAGSTITEIAASHVSMVSHPAAAIDAILAAVAAIDD